MRLSTSLLLGLLTILAVQAQAHTRLSAATPADASVTPSSPEALVLEFNGDVRLLSVSLTSADDAQIDIGPLSEMTQTTFSIPIRATLSAGDYRITWRAVGADTHPVSGEIRFSVANGDSLASR